MSEPEARAWVSLGSNLGDRLSYLRDGARDIDRLPRTRVTVPSRIYETLPLGPSEHRFLNAVVELRTGLSASALLSELLAIERRYGRERTARWTARTLDLDLLLYWPAEADEPLTLRGAELRLPHPEMQHRDFVLAPLVDVGLDWPLHEGRSAGDLLRALPDSARTVLRPRPEPLLPRDPAC